jgi:hypothetical protein
MSGLQGARLRGRLPPTQTLPGQGEVTLISLVMPNTP